MAKRRGRGPETRRTWHGAHLERGIFARAVRTPRNPWPPRRRGARPGSDPIAFYLWTALLMLLAFGAVWAWTGWRAEQMPDATFERPNPPLGASLPRDEAPVDAPAAPMPSLVEDNASPASMPSFGEGDAFDIAPARTARFASCDGGSGGNCVVDGDTFRIGGERIRILDIDTPELSPPRCAEEERLGLAAKARLGELLSAGPVELARGAGEDDRDRYGRLLRTAHVGGRSVGDALIAEGLARPYGSGRRSWC